MSDVFIEKEILLFLINTYNSPSRLFIQGGGEICLKKVLRKAIRWRCRGTQLPNPC